MLVKITTYLKQSSASCKQSMVACLENLGVVKVSFFGNAGVDDRWLHIPVDQYPK